MSDVRKLQKEIEVLADEAQFAIGQADTLSEKVSVLGQENRELKNTLNRLIKLVSDTEGDIPRDDLLGIVYGTR
jgi:hypothetical protein